MKYKVQRQRRLQQPDAGAAAGHLAPRSSGPLRSSPPASTARRCTTAASPPTSRCRRSRTCRCCTGSTRVGRDGGRAVDGVVEHPGAGVQRERTARDTRGAAGVGRHVARSRSARTIASTTSGRRVSAWRSTRRRSTTPTPRRGCRTPIAGGWRSAAQYKWTPNLKFDAGFVYIFADSPGFNQNAGQHAAPTA